MKRIDNVQFVKLVDQEVILSVGDREITIPQILVASKGAPILVPALDQENRLLLIWGDGEFDKFWQAINAELEVNAKNGQPGFFSRFEDLFTNDAAESSVATELDDQSTDDGLDESSTKSAIHRPDPAEQFCDGLNECGEAVGNFFEENEELCTGMLIGAGAVGSLWLIKKILF